MALCGGECIDLTTKAIKILSVNFSYKKQIQNDGKLPHETHY